MTVPAQLDVVPVANATLWAEALAGIEHDFYHEAAYHEFCQTLGEGDAYLAIYREGESVLVWPYLLRPIDGLGVAGYCDVTSVYGYPGPLAHGAPTEFLARGVSAVKEHWKSRRAVTAFTRLHPLLANQHIVEAVEPAKVSGVTVAIDLTRTSEQVRADYRKSLKRELRQARESGLVVKAEADRGALERFAELYRETMRRNQASRSYFFELDYFERLFASFPGRVHLFTVRAGTAMAAGGIFVESRGIVQYHLSGSDQRYSRLAPTKLLLDEVRLWAAMRGNHFFHLGGGRGGQRDSLFAFKAAFSSEHYPFYVWKCVLQPTLSDELCRLQLRQAGHDAGSGSCEYFPAYRRMASAS